jgi:hypothetical protein
MATIKKAQLGNALKKTAKAVSEAAPKKPMSLAKKVKELKFQKAAGTNLTRKEFNKIGKDAVKGTSYSTTPKSSPVVLTAEQKANNARILKQGRRKNGGKVTKARSGKKVKKAFLGNVLGAATGILGGGGGGGLLGGLLGGGGGGLLGGLLGGGGSGGAGGGAMGALGGLKKTLGGSMKKGGKVMTKRKAKTGTSLGMKSVKAGYDKNPGVTRADIITAATKKAKSGTSMKKCKYGCK